MTLPLNKNFSSTLKVSLSIITDVTSKTINEIFWINFELFFLKTPKISKDIIDNERNISGKTSSRFIISNYSLHLGYRL